MTARDWAILAGVAFDTSFILWLLLKLARLESERDILVADGKYLLSLIDQHNARIERANLELAHKAMAREVLRA